MRIKYYNLSDAQYQNLVCCLCKKILGPSTQTYSPGRDDGKDASFTGTAKCFPTWTGKIIVQAKHTRGIVAKFSDPKFYSEKSKSSVLALELPKIKSLVEKGDLDYYMLFSNRTISGEIDIPIKKYISKNTGIPVDNIYLCGNDDMEHWLKMYPEVEVWAEIKPGDFPLTVPATELAEVILRLEKNKEAVLNDEKKREDTPAIPVRTPFPEKVILNTMSDGYANLIKDEIKNFRDIEIFLQSDDESRERYDSVVTELNAKIVSKRRDFEEFNEIIEYIYDLYIDQDIDLKKNKSTLRQLLYYMFWFCDIGENKKND